MTGQEGIPLPTFYIVISKICFTLYKLFPYSISIKVYNATQDVYLLCVRRYEIKFESVVSMDRYMTYTYFNKGLPVSFKCKV